MLQFPSGIAFRMDIGNLFQLQGSFESNRIINVPAYINEVLTAIQFLRKLPEFAIVQHLLLALRQLVRRLNAR